MLIGEDNIHYLSFRVCRSKNVWWVVYISQLNAWMFCLLKNLGKHMRWWNALLWLFRYLDELTYPYAGQVWSWWPLAFVHRMLTIACRMISFLNIVLHFHQFLLYIWKWKMSLMQFYTFLETSVVTLSLLPHFIAFFSDGEIPGTPGTLATTFLAFGKV